MDNDWRSVTGLSSARYGRSTDTKTIAEGRNCEKDSPPCALLLLLGDRYILSTAGQHSFQSLLGSLGRNYRDVFVKISRRSMLLTTGAAVLHSASAPLAQAALVQSPSGRPPVAERRFSSPVIERVIRETSRRIADPKLAAMFEQCFPNTVDTTVFFRNESDGPDTFVITGDIDAMWLRDSSSQVWPYLQFAREDPQLRLMLAGVVRRQAKLILIDPYANAFVRSPEDPPLRWAVSDATSMAPSVAERKWEVDSLCHVVRLAHGYWQATGDTSPFDAAWKASAWKIVETFREQQRKDGQGPYRFQRSSKNPTDTLPLRGYGNPARPVGMISSMFRPSDDACIFPLYIPGNLFAVQALGKLRQLAHEVVHDPRLGQACDGLQREVQLALEQYGKADHAAFGKIWAYEVDGYGSLLMMDDANVPSLLSLPYIGSCPLNDPLYQRTRQFVLSDANPYYLAGRAGAGLGSPHTGRSSIWPMGIILQAMTSSDDGEIVRCLRLLRDTTAGTGFMHESFDKDSALRYTRPWFAWANTLFGELILATVAQRPRLLGEPL
jgi:hypothetical protein